MPTWTIILTVVGSVVTGGYGLARYRMRLLFLSKTFDRNGDRRDLEVAGRVTAPGWTQFVGSKGQARDDPDATTEPDPIQRVLGGPSPSTPA